MREDVHVMMMVSAVVYILFKGTTNYEALNVDESLCLRELLILKQGRKVGLDSEDNFNFKVLFSIQIYSGTSRCLK